MPYVRVFRFITAMSVLMGFLASQFIYLVDLHESTIYFSLAIAVSGALFFVLSFIPILRDKSYGMFMIYITMMAILLSLLATINGSEKDLVFNLVISYLIFVLFVNKRSHLNISTGFIFSSYLLMSFGFFWFGQPQNLFNVLLFFFVGGLVFLWKTITLGSLGVINSVVDKKTEELRDEQTKLKAAISAITGLLVIIDNQGKVVLTNHKYKEVFGINYEPNTLTEIQQIFGGSYDVSGAYSLCQRQSQVIDHSSVEFKDKFLRVLLAPVFETDEKSGKQVIMGVLILMGDVTEEELLDRARDEFFAIASHELRTPLTAIQGNLALVLDYIDSGRLEHDKVIEMLQDAMKSSKRLIRLVHDFLDLSRLEQGRVKFAEQKVDMAKLAQEVLLEYEQEMKIKNITYALNNNSNGLLVFADEDRVKQVIVNLVSNAVKYSQKGVITVTVQPKENMLEIQVADNGVGIEPENQKYLFRKFQQAGKNVLSRDTSQGSGLGLYISRLVIRAMGGDVYLVNSDSGKGSIFGFTLPVKR